MEIRRVLELPSDIDALRMEASNEGFRFIEKLVNEWNSEANRFDKPGEVFAGAFENGRLVAVGGLNVDPYMEDIAIARCAIYTCSNVSVAKALRLVSFVTCWI